jgi:glyoxylase-like metal-dependent hydrolase (beta-lactamase superfamily II)
MRLEDQAGDVLKKFRFGRKRGVRDISEASGIDMGFFREIESGEKAPSQAQLVSLGQTLDFDGAAMARIHLHPEATPETIPSTHVLPVQENFSGYAVWCTLIRHRSDPRRALLFDTGGGGRILRETIRTHGLRIEGILLTHGHEDHGGEFYGIPTESDVPVLLSEADRPLLPEISRAKGPLLTPEEGCEFLRTRGWPVSTIAAPGHTPGSVAYLMDGTLLVGDTIFCGSAGRCFSPEHFLTQLDSIHRLISGNSPDTVIIPGHGPFTTPSQERSFNPFVRVREKMPELFF